jgi:four helix bundle protein
VAAQVLAKQLLRSGTSIGANYREASRARSNAEFISSIGISLKEAEESLYWLELLGEARLGEPAVIEPLVRETEELCAILTTIAKKAKTRSE